MPTPYSIGFRLTGTAVPATGVGGSPVIGRTYDLALNSAGNLPIAAFRVSAGASQTFNLAALPNYTTAGQTAATTCKGYLVVVELDGTGATPSGNAMVTDPGGTARNISPGGLSVFAPNPGASDITGNLVVNLSGAIGQKATIYVWR